MNTLELHRRARRACFMAAAIAAVLSPRLTRAEDAAKPAAHSLDEIVVQSNYTTYDRLDTATGLGLTKLGRHLRV